MEKNKLFSIEEYPRSFKVVPNGKFPVYKIVAEDNKEVPTALSGQYVTIPSAKNAINIFLYNYEQEEIKKAKYHKRRELTKRRQDYEEKNGRK
jgi:hypothetical protein